MHDVTHMTMGFIPGLKTQSGRAWFHWHADVGGKKWGKVVELEGSPLELTIDEFRRLAMQSLDELEAVRRMSPEEMAQAEAAAKAAADQAMRQAS